MFLQPTATVFPRNSSFVHIVQSKVKPKDHYPSLPMVGRTAPMTSKTFFAIHDERILKSLIETNFNIALFMEFQESMEITFPILFGIVRSVCIVYRAHMVAALLNVLMECRPYCSSLEISYSQSKLLANIVNRLPFHLDSETKTRMRNEIKFCVSLLHFQQHGWHIIR